MFSIFNKNWRNFVFSFTKRELKARYRGTFLGFLWMFLNPVFQMLIIGFIFQFFIPVHSEGNYFLYLFAGLLPWNFFSYTLSKVTPSFVFERSLIQKSAFPREAIPLSIILSNFFHFLIGLLIYMFVLLMNGEFSLHWFLVPIFLMWIFILTLSFSIIFSTLNVRFRDMNFFVQAVMPLWFYATPIIYPLSAIPKEFYFLFVLNPFYYPIELLRRVLLFGYLFGPENRMYVALSLLIALVLFLFSLSLFKKESPNFDDWM